MKRCYIYLTWIILSRMAIDSVQAQKSDYEIKKDDVFTRRPKAIYIELLGSSGFGTSVNYDMRFNKSHKGLGFRIGVAQPNTVGRSTSCLFPVLINHVSSTRQAAFEVGAGFDVVYRNTSYEDFNNIIHYSHSFVYPAVANVGIRFQPLKTGIVWRLYWAPTWEILSTQKSFTGWIGTSLGIGFN